MQRRRRHSASAGEVRPGGIRMRRCSTVGVTSLVLKKATFGLVASALPCFFCSSCSSLISPSITKRLQCRDPLLRTPTHLYLQRKRVLVRAAVTTILAVIAVIVVIAVVSVRVRMRASRHSPPPAPLDGSPPTIRSVSASLFYYYLCLSLFPSVCQSLLCVRLTYCLFLHCRLS